MLVGYGAKELRSGSSLEGSEVTVSVCVCVCVCERERERERENHYQVPVKVWSTIKHFQCVCARAFVNHYQVPMKYSYTCMQWKCMGSMSCMTCCMLLLLIEADRSWWWVESDASPPFPFSAASRSQLIGCPPAYCLVLLPGFLLLPVNVTVRVWVIHSCIRTKSVPGKFISLLQCLCNFSHTIVVITFLILHGCEPVVRFWCELYGNLLFWILWCQKVLKILKCNLKSFGEHSFSFVTPSVWNLLPANLWNFPILSLLWVQNSAQEFPV